MTTQLEQAARLALEALEIEDMACRYEKDPTPEHIAKAITALCAALEQPAQDEPVGEVLNERGEVDWISFVPATGTSLYTRPQQPAQDEPVALNREYAQRLIEALHENGDPVSVDAAEEFERLLTSTQAREPLTDEQLREIENKINPNMRWRSSDEEGITLYPGEYYDLVRAIEQVHGIGEKK